jgi:hypothetical protein
VQDFIQQFKDEPRLLGNFMQLLSPSEKTIATATLSRLANRSFLLLQMKAQLARITFRNGGYYAVNATGDDVVLKAMQVLHSDQYLKIISR